MRRWIGIALTLLTAGALLGVFATPAEPHLRPAPAAPGTTAPPGPVRSGGPGWPALSVTALGDSVTAGTHCDCEPFPELYATALHTRYATPVEVANDGVPGQTSGDVVTELADDRSVQADVAASNVIVLTIGANDFGPDYEAITTDTCGGTDDLVCVHPELATLGDRLHTILTAVARLRDEQPTAVLVTGYWNDFEDGEVAAASMSSAGRATTDQLTRASNRVTRDAAARAGATYVDLYVPFEGESSERDPTRLLAADGDHPNAAGHRLIAQTLLAAGLVPLAPH